MGKFQARKSGPFSLSGALRVVLSAALLSALSPAQQIPPQNTGIVIKSYSELVLVNATVRDQQGKAVDGLKPENFTILEDNKPQKIASFDFENVNEAAPSGPQQEAVLGAPTAARTAAPTPAPTPAPDVKEFLKHRRLVVLFFDMSSLEPDEVDRGVAAAETFLDKQMSPADLVAVVSLASSFVVNLDFTADRAQLRKVLQGFSSASGQGFEQGSTGTTEGTPDTGQAFTVDETEYNIFNTDFRLEALRSLCGMLSGMEQKKSVIYISNGMTRTGIENQAELRAAVNAAVRANVALYTLDVRGLQALVPGGDAQLASLRGTSPYSGAATQNALNSNFSSQETLTTLAADTGGRAFLDTNDFGSVFRAVQQDTATYYVLGYHSTNPARDGRYRHISVRVNVPGLKLEYRPGYYAPRDFQHFDKEDRERQLDVELAAEIPSTDLRVFLSAAYFRMRDDKIFTAVSLLVPGSEIPFTKSNNQDQAALDVSGIVQDAQKRPVGRIRETIKVTMPESAEAQRKNVQYDTAFVLAPGKYHLRVALRENQSGKLGSFQTDLDVPDFKATPVKASSIVLASQMQPSKRSSDSPLLHDGTELIPNVTHVFSQKQHLYLYYEVYDPATEANGAANQGGSTERGGAERAGAERRGAEQGVRERGSAEQGGAERAEPGIRVLSNVLFFNGKVKAYETPVVEARSLTIQNRHAAVFQLDIPLEKLRPGFYTCQVNVIDDAAGKFVFRRLPLKLLQ